MYLKWHLTLHLLINKNNKISKKLLKQLSYQYFTINLQIEKNKLLLLVQGWIIKKYTTVFTNNSLSVKSVGH
jgi:hypothetical protein